MTNNILGVSAFYHDSAACLLVDGKVVAAAQEERFSRLKHDASFPGAAIQYCLAEGGLSVNDIGCLAFYEYPNLKFGRVMETYWARAPKGFRSFKEVVTGWAGRREDIHRIVWEEVGYEGHVAYVEHHLSHAASAFYPSPFLDAAILTIDGVGEWATTTWGVGSGGHVELIQEMRFPNSVGLLYSAFTQYTGFRMNSGEYKVMGLAPYGVARYRNMILDYLIDLRPDGSFKLNMEYFDFLTGYSMTNEKFHSLFGGPPRKPDSGITQREMDLARSVQEVIEHIVQKMVSHIVRETGSRDLCMAGGVALNCVNNGKILRSGKVDRLWIQPAAGDAGGALGACLTVYHLHQGSKRERASQFSCSLGPGYTAEEVRAALEVEGADFRQVEDPAKEGARLLQEGRVLGWFQGRMEFGPRALGNRSILADPRSVEMQSMLNLKIKFRESFRPFAPIVSIEDVSHYFDMECESPYMLLVANVSARHLLPESQKSTGGGLEMLKVHRSSIPAVTHVDNSARIQTVSEEDNPLLHRLLAEFKKLTGCGVLVNTSFNIRDEPIVESPEQAYRCFQRTGMDALILETFLVQKPNTVGQAG